MRFVDSIQYDQLVGTIDQNSASCGPEPERRGIVYCLLPFPRLDECQTQMVVGDNGLGSSSNGRQCAPAQASPARINYLPVIHLFYSGDGQRPPGMQTTRARSAKKHALRQLVGLCPSRYQPVAVFGRERLAAVSAAKIPHPEFGCVMLTEFSDVICKDDMAVSNRDCNAPSLARSPLINPAPNLRF